MRNHLMLMSFPLALGLSASAQTGDIRLEQPIRLEAGGKPINVDVGHAAPFLCDFDGDGVTDLLVGQFGQGRLRIYRNHGTNAKPEYRDFQYFKTGQDFGVVPSG